MTGNCVGVASSKENNGVEFISVIISLYNQRRFIRTILSSLLSQTTAVPYEILLCDDGSSDNVLTEVSKWSSGHSDIDMRYIWQPDKGFRLSRSRNNGIRSARGDVLVFSDGDMWLAPYFLEDHVAAHIEPKRLVCGATLSVAIDDNMLANDSVSFNPELIDPTQATFSRRALWLATERPWMACTGANFSIRTVDSLLFDETFEGWGSEDRDLSFRLYERGLQPHLIGRVGAVDLRIEGATVAWNPFKGGETAGIIAVLKSKLALWRKYPGNLMAPSLSLVERCHFNASTGKWWWGPPRGDASVFEILSDFEKWLERGRSTDQCC
jgi:glycosyltransferase involved in cell wall biosynthesis